MSTSTRAAATAVSLLVLLALAAGGCSNDSDGSGASAPSSSPSPSAPAADPVRTKTMLGTVTGRLAKRDRLRVASAAGDVVDGWFDAAYVGGDYPRRAFDDAFPGFTPGARAQECPVQGDQPARGEVLACGDLPPSVVFCENNSP